METKLNNWDAFIDYLNQIFFEDVILTMSNDQVNFYWTEFNKA